MIEISGDLALQTDPFDNNKVFIISKTTKKQLSLPEVLHLYGLDTRDIPLNEKECEEYYQQYLHSNSDSLTYTSNFWNPVSRTGIELEFCCLDKNMINNFEKKITPFLNFVIKTDSPFFKIDIIEKYFNEWKEIIVTFEEKAQTFNADALYFDEVRYMLNTLLLMVDPDKTIINWSF